MVPLRTLKSLAVALLCSTLACATASTGPDPGGWEPTTSAPTGRPDGEPGVESAEAEHAKAESAGTETADIENADVETGDVPVTEPDPDAPEVQAQKEPSELQRRASSAFEGLIIGTVIGGQIGGTYGAAAGAVIFGMYGIVTGDVPFDAGAQDEKKRGGHDPEEALDQEIEGETAKQDELESEIEQELRRQEELIAAIEQQEQIDQAARTEQKARESSLPADPLSAPPVPYERPLPDSIFERSERKVGGRRQTVKSLDADRDGRPEIEMVVDPESGRTISRSEDTDYDGRLDAYNTYGDDGVIIRRAEDTDQDGREDRWIRYEGGRATRIEVDRNYDGTKDAFQIFRADTLAYEELDGDGDGRIDRRIDYAERRRTLESEDVDRDGRLDAWTHYDDKERPARIERDSNGDGRADRFEFFEGPSPTQMKLVRMEEDLDADGTIDVVSHYANGKLVRKDVQNPAALKQG